MACETGLHGLMMYCVNRVHILYILTLKGAEKLNISETAFNECPQQGRRPFGLLGPNQQNVEVVWLVLFLWPFPIYLSSMPPFLAAIHSVPITSAPSTFLWQCSLDPNHKLSFNENSPDTIYSCANQPVFHVISL